MGRFKPKFADILTKDFLYQKYVIEHISPHKIAKLVSADAHTVYNYIDKYTASIDRIDNSIGYIASNIHFVHRIVNRSRMYFNLDYYKQICKLISNYKV